MNAHTAEKDLVLLNTGFSQTDLFGSPVPARARQRGIVARMMGWLAARAERRAVVAELSQLSDRELSDIGLVRSDVPFVFDRTFAAMREEQRDGAGRAFGAYGLG